MSYTVIRIPEIPNLELGEGPHWDPLTQNLYLVDISGKSIHRYDTSSRQHFKTVFDKPVSVIIPVQNQKDKFVVSLERELVILTWDGQSEKPNQIEKIADVDGDTQNRMNDGKCDPRGRLWIGTMGPEPENLHIEPQRGSLYSVDKKNVTKHITEIGISNGLAWNTNINKFYYVDSFAFSVDEFDYDIASGKISNRRPIFTLSKHGIPGFLDGITIDEDGNLWVAIFNGYRVIQIDPTKPETLLQTIDIPAKQVTSVVWGGKNLDILYVTSGSLTVDGKEHPPPNHGATFQVIGLNTKGLPPNNFVL